jgi:hypothetical protein
MVCDGDPFKRPTRAHPQVQDRGRSQTLDHPKIESLAQKTRLRGLTRHSGSAPSSRTRQIIFLLVSGTVLTCSRIREYSDFITGSRKSPGADGRETRLCSRLNDGEQQCCGISRIIPHKHSTLIPFKSCARLWTRRGRLLRATRPHPEKLCRRNSDRGKLVSR